MFAPTKIWRKWHRKVNVNQKRYALVSALAASAVPALVMARGHKIDGVSEIPFVVDDALCKLTKTKEAVSFLQKNGCYADVERVSESKKIRCGKGKMRNRRYTMRVGPMVVYADGEEAVAELCEAGNTGILLPPFEKGDLFRGVVLGGVLPRKTFSMGHARDKRYYLECRAIV